MIRVFLVDDQNIIREGVKTLLSQNNKIKIIGEAQNGESALQKIGLLHPDVVLLDINLPDIDGFVVAEKISHKFQHVKTIILSSNEQESYVKKAVSLGAKGYLSKNVSSEELESTIELVHQGYSVIKPEVAKEDPSVASSTKLERIVSDSAIPAIHDRTLESQASDSVRASQISFPKIDREQTKSNLDNIEKLLTENHLQQRYAKYRRRKPKNRLFYNANWEKLKKTVASFEFVLLVLIILFCLSFLTAIALSK